ncbi:MAG: 2-C-methyl-D-erythritol 4-phosphate cytidylyltransferase [Candidatus Omnitrophica bacterium]|nr:2-C-methyl-D-erythritol 4-phosphate cytidylyltransferase [Candidatus Omnitrophota bacterium]
MKVQAIIPAAGIGARLKSQVPKPLVMLKGKPLFVYALEILTKSSMISSVILVVNAEAKPELERIVKELSLLKPVKVVIGGETRRESVFNGLQSTDDATEYVVVHDGARPLVSQSLLEEAIEKCRQEAAVVVAVPVKPTIKRVAKEGLYVEATLDRSFLWEVQTPQVFKKQILLKAHQQAGEILATDDASLVEALGEKVKVLEGDYKNIKVTTQEDLLIAEALIGNHS